MYSNKFLFNRNKELQQSVANEEKKILLGKNKNTGLGKTLLSKSKDLNFKIQRENESPSMSLFGKYNNLTNNEKDKLTLFERSAKQGEDYERLRNAPKVVDTRISGDLGYDSKDTQENYEKFDKILYYAQKYKIPFASAGIKKLYIELAGEIRKYEVKNLKEIIKKPIDKKYNEYGLYIKKY